MNQQPKENEDKTNIYYDGSCPMCTAFIGKVDNSSKKEEFSLKDINTEPLPSGFRKAKAEKEIHVMDSQGIVYKNSEAILRILAEYPHWNWLVKISRLPLIKHLPPLGYKYIAANRHFLFGPSSRLFWIKIVTVLGLIAGMLLSIRLWIPDRIFPYAPIFENFIVLTPLAEVSLVILLFVQLVMVLVHSKPQKFIFASFLFMVAISFFDQMRWQPWFYQYFFMLATLGLFSWNYTDTKKQQLVVSTLQLIVGSIYFFSGLQKINLVFINDIFPWIVEPIANIFPQSLTSFIYSLGIIVPFVEIGIGLGLLTKRFKKYAIVGAVLMHGFVLIALGPAGHNWNSVIWPWNITMMFIVLILFWRAKELSILNFFRSKNFLFKKLVLLLFIIMPIFSFFNIWDSYLSSSLYSGNTNKVQILLSNSVQQKIPSQIQNYTTRVSENRHIIDLSQWSFDELNVPIYPERRVFKHITRYLCEYANTSRDVELIVYPRSTIFNKGYKSNYDCSTL